MAAVTDRASGAVTYVGLPVSSGGAHSLGSMTRRVAYDRAMSFLRTCTELSGPIDYSFAVHDVPELPRQRALERKLRHRFGNYRVIDAERVPEALDLLDDIHPQPENRWGMAPVWFAVSSRFRILDPASRQPLSDQDPEGFGRVEYEWGVPLGTSGLRLTMDNRARMAVELCIPTIDEAALERIVPWLQEHLPFRLSPKHWRRWTTTKTGSFKRQRLNAPARWLSPRDTDAR